MHSVDRGATHRSRHRRRSTVPHWTVQQSTVGNCYSAEFRSRPAYATTRETTVYVHPDHQRLGAGRELMNSLLREIGARGARLAVAVIALPNEASVALHEGLGFTPVGIIRCVAHKFDTWHDEGIWQLDLGSP